MVNTQHKTNTLSTWDNQIVVDTQTCKYLKKEIIIPLYTTYLIDNEWLQQFIGLVICG
jgi:hypothetical protein